MTIAEQIATTLARRIMTGELAPDTPLRQDHVAKEFQSSHVPVREAFRKLEEQRLVVSVPRHGVRVAPMNRDALKELTEMRVALECLGLRTAMQTTGAVDIPLLQKLIDKDVGTDPKDLIQLEELNVAFHLALISGSGMPFLVETVMHLHRTSSRLMIAMWRELPDWQYRSADEHRQILDAIRDGDAALACIRLEGHIRGGAKGLSAQAARIPD